MQSDLEAGTAAAAAPSTLLYAQLYAQVLAAILMGAALGYFQPATGEAMKPLGTVSSSSSR